ISHVKKKKECAPVPDAATRYPCLKDGWGAEPVCCGQECKPGKCNDSVWAKKTQISRGTAQGCGSVSSDRNGGILCCKDATPPVRETPPVTPAITGETEGDAPSDEAPVEAKVE